MNVFDILGPVMIGPSSSHTAGAVKIGLVARQLLGDTPKKAKILLHGSFASTGVGHGTDKAIVAGLLGMQPDDKRIPDSFAAAKQQGLDFSFDTIHLRGAHPNTAVLTLEDGKKRKLEIEAASLGGGRIQVRKIDGIDTNFSGEYNTLIVHNLDQPGHVAQVTTILAQRNVNIATMQLYRNVQGGYAVMVIECDQPIPEDLVDWLMKLDGIIKVSYINVKQ
ncbi:MULTISPECIES: L-serine ammonia-lyase, iron-sulfur-dependent subunit beta [Caproicibacterium]|jgi:L-serine dehydratase|uniref:L-serine deaminase n=1 Tax=Caproicibacterium lactatifermentans TaxID=2666138 RepID=A0A859DR51_9FIRM|nr:L-serine ammonia-lyase, iron-sulfur-dependent subunit beta [Caproicibacterium lactatifermentans]ARP50342.1 L-serine ammonia-lyase, iron-sulfur-dependent, subunit beta [Ruminococcaceae bacterium CPB6]QKN23935.1 L-serine ammonia-lyase, iron-sulfur-dependent, subunit beta [Caproicibacterium lactatifermentans]QKO30994.1 L-serine ammonia-lyase, iron-sulfur-dependent, subunit beta [Caproicibacterium lactatifermentans]